LLGIRGNLWSKSEKMRIIQRSFIRNLIARISKRTLIREPFSQKSPLIKNIKKLYKKTKKKPHKTGFA